MTRDGQAELKPRLYRKTVAQCDGQADPKPRLYGIVAGCDGRVDSKPTSTSLTVAAGLQTRRQVQRRTVNDVSSMRT